MDDATRAVAWAIAEAWWRKTHAAGDGAAPEVESSAEYADNFWQSFRDEAAAAQAALDAHAAASARHHPIASDRFA